MKTEQCQNYWCTSTLITLHKKGSVKNAATIELLLALNSHPSKW